MTAADYLAQADNLIAMANETDGVDFTHQRTNLILRALVAAVSAVAVELGVPPTPAAGTGGSGG